MTVKESIQKIIDATGSKAAAARELSVSVRTVDNWLKIETPAKPRDIGLARYLEGVANELDGAR